MLGNAKKFLDAIKAFPKDKMKSKTIKKINQ
jgi:hypothetical protein